MSRTRRRGLRLENGILEHHLHAPPERPQCAGRQVVDALAVEDHLTGRDLEEAQDAAPDRRFSAARLADQRQRLAFLDLEGDTVHGIDGGRAHAERPGVNEEVLLEVVDLEERRGHAAIASFGA